MLVEDCRHAALRLFNADPAYFDLVFVANATAGIKLVQEAFRSQKGGFRYLYHRDSHTSLVGLREAASAGKHCFESDDDVDRWLSAAHSQSLSHADSDERLHVPPTAWSGSSTTSTSLYSPTPSSSSSQNGDQNIDPPVHFHGTSALKKKNEDHEPVLLFAYPAQSNMNGRRLPLSWPGIARKAGVPSRQIYTLLDAAALVSTSPLDLADPVAAPDFTVLSFYKIYGFPDLGALIVRKEALSLFQDRSYFGGGTVEMVSSLREQWHMRKTSSLHDTLEDGTLPVHNILALSIAIDVHHDLFGTFYDISCHSSRLFKALYSSMRSLRHANGSPLCQLYTDDPSNDSHPRTNGPIIAFNLKNSQGAWLSNTEIEKLASIHNVHLRSGGLCNPGGMAAGLQLSPWELRENFSAGARCGNDTDVINNKPTGMLRVSLGAMSTDHDVECFVSFLQQFFVENNIPPAVIRESPNLDPGIHDLVIEQLVVYPIKSCAGYSVPQNVDWAVHAEGLAWDRAWCLVHAGTSVVLSQKRYPKMALIRPTLDFDNGVLRVQILDSKSEDGFISQEIAVALSANPNAFVENEPTHDATAQVCGDEVNLRRYGSAKIVKFFSTFLGVPCLLARFPRTNGSDSLTRHAKPDLQNPYSPKNTWTPGVKCEAASQSLLLSNESPILVITRESLEKLNDDMHDHCRNGNEEDVAEYLDEIQSAVFRANVVLDAFPKSKTVRKPYVEDGWTKIHAGSLDLQLLGRCRRCQMVCINQQTAERSKEPFTTLANTRRDEGKVWFGVHAAMSRHGREQSSTQSPTLRVGEHVLAS